MNGVAHQPLDLSTARILVTNDDGLHAPGLAALEKIAHSLSDDVWVVAPEFEQSGASHSLTMSRPLRLNRYTDRRFGVDGTPTDCVLLALNRVMDERRPDLILSGVNRGANLAEDVSYSGTIAAAKEATLLNTRAIALSLEIGNGPFHWETAIRFAPEIISGLVAESWGANTLYNVNFPHCTPDHVTRIRMVRHGQRKIGEDLQERIDPRGRPYFWVGNLLARQEVQPDTDVAVIAARGISITPLHLDSTEYNVLKAMQGKLDRDVR